jgi:hypothetical protein
MKKQRLGNDPMEWIKNTKSKQTKCLEQSNQDKKLSFDKFNKLTDSYVRATFIVKKSLLETFKDYAYTERKNLKQLINEVLESFLVGKKIIHRKK